MLGANGAGKTTLLRTISGLVRADSGSVRVRRPRADPDCRPSGCPASGMAHVPEGRGVITELTVEENLRLGGLGRGNRVRPERLDRVFALFPVLAGPPRRQSPTCCPAGSGRCWCSAGP